MRYSQLFSKTTKSVPQDIESSVNAKLLVQGGFVRQEMAGVYSWLPLGLRVLRKIERIIREELDRIGAQEILMPALQPKEAWVQTERWNAMDVLFKVPSQTGKEYALGPTHEEVVTPLAKAFIESYKDLPFAVYQIQTKFRDELRAKSGVMRGREFGMKDLYSFHTSQEDLEAYYQTVLETYLTIFSRMGLQVKIVEASGGSFSKKFSHEFQVLTDAGEDMILTSPSWKYGQNSEVATYKEGDACPDHPGETLSWQKGVEVGNIFQLGTKFSEAFDVSYTDQDGQRKIAIMGCYGIGTTRLVGTAVEALHDERGMCWPASIAPFHVQLITIRSRDEAMQAEVTKTAEQLSRDLEAKGIEVLWDDRPETSPGAKFADADLIGLPLRLVISERMLKENSIEWKARTATEAEIISKDTVLEKAVAFFQK